MSDRVTCTDPNAYDRIVQQVVGTDKCNILDGNRTILARGLSFDDAYKRACVSPPGGRVLWLNNDDGSIEFYKHRLPTDG